MALKGHEKIILESKCFNFKSDFGLFNLKASGSKMQKTMIKSNLESLYLISYNLQKKVYISKCILMLHFTFLNNECINKNNKVLLFFSKSVVMFE